MICPFKLVGLLVLQTQQEMQHFNSSFNATPTLRQMARMPGITQAGLTM